MSNVEYSDDIKEAVLLSPEQVINPNDGRFQAEFEDYVRSTITNILQLPESNKISEEFLVHHIDSINKKAKALVEEFEVLANDEERQTAYLRLTQFLKSKKLRIEENSMNPYSLYRSSNNHQWIFIDTIVRKLESDNENTSELSINQIVNHEQYWKGRYVRARTGNVINLWFMTDKDIHIVTKDAITQRLSSSIGSWSYRGGATLDDIERR